MAALKHSVKLNLQKTDPQNKATQIRAHIRFNNKLVIVGTGESIEPRYWNTEKNEPKLTARLKDADKLKAKLKDICKWLSDAFEFEASKENEYPDPEKLKEAAIYTLKNKGAILGQSNRPTRVTLAQYIDRLIADTEKGRRTSSRGEVFAPGTVRHYNSAKGVITRFLAHISKPDILFEEIDMKFYYDFRDFAYTNEELSDNYFGTCIKFLKTVMNEAADEGLNANMIYKNKKFVKVNIDVENIYLTADQLEIMFKKDLSKLEKLDRVRDLFLVGCWTGLRFSDFTNIQPENIDGNFIDIKTQKTGEKIAIPIHPTVKAILEKYAGKTPNSLPPPISNVKMNEYLKDLGKELDFDEIITLEKNRGGRIEKQSKALHELLTTHTARRSFASNMFRLGVPSMIIMAVTGHRSEASFMKYIKVTPREKAAIMAEIWQRQAMKVVNGE